MKQAMKKIYLIGAFLIALGTQLNAQAPQGINYQAVIRNPNGSTVNNSGVGLQMRILQGSAAGTAVYVETFSETTSNIGLVNVVVGQGTVVAGNFSMIDWGNGPYFLEVGADANGGTSYTVMGTQQMMSVPYALYAENSGNSSSNSVNIGDFYQGGYVFYLDPSGTGGLIVMPTDIMNNSYNYTWDDANNVINNAKCNGYTDWYLPSLAEWQMVFANLGNVGFRDPYYSVSTSPTVRVYWSSTIVNSSAHYGINFDDGIEVIYMNNVDLRIRGIRAFTF